MGPASALKRALIKLLLAIAREFAITLSMSRDNAPDEQVKKAFRKVILRIHPDKLDRQTNRQTDIGRQTDGQRDRETDRHTDRQRDRQTDSQTETETTQIKTTLGN